ncbi:MAG: hypothetical protein HN576_16295 [Bacteriovoracaceae bacterium]|jgi:hypothetical protein|nr:hypothetical protein [Bacteriovoracaceae bacterium]
MAQDYHEILKQLDLDIRNARIVHAAKEVIRLRKRYQIPRRFAAQLGEIAIRCGQPKHALLELHPYVRPEEGTVIEANTSEKMIYAYALIKVGANRDATKLLEEVDVVKNPKAYFYLGISHLPEWNHAKAVECFQAFLKSNKGSEYENIVTKANLVESQIFLGDYINAHEILDELRDYAALHGLELLRAHCFELSVQVAIGMENWNEAQSFLAKNQEGHSKFDQLILKKWKIVIDHNIYGHKPSHVSQLKQLAKKSISLGYFEHARSCYFYLALYSKKTRQQQLTNFLYHGTSSEFFREKLKQEGLPIDQVPSEYIWTGDPFSKAKDYFDIVTARGTDGSTLKKGQKVHRLLLAHTKDFFRPFSTIAIYQQLFPDHYYNPKTSPLQVADAKFRLKKWVTQSKLPLELANINDLSYLSIRSQDYGIKLKLGESFDNAKDARFLLLKDMWSDIRFSSKQVANLLKVSPRTANVLLKTLESEEKIKKYGQGRSTSYMIT